MEFLIYAAFAAILVIGVKSDLKFRKKNNE